MLNGRYGYNFMYQGKRYRKQGIRTKTEAKSRIRNILSDAAKSVDANSNELFAEYFERWLEVNKIDKVEDKTYSRHLSTFDKLKDFFPSSTRIKDLDQMKYQEFINHHAEDMVKDSVKKVPEPIKAALDDSGIPMDSYSVIRLTRRIYGSKRNLRKKSISMCNSRTILISKNTLKIKIQRVAYCFIFY